MSLVELVQPTSAPTPTERCSRRENSNLIQISSRDTSIWRGKLWSAITFKIKIDNYFVRNAAGGAPYTLHPSIVDSKTREVYGPSSELVKLKFGKNTRTLDTAIATVTSDSHNTIEAEFHRDLFENGDSFSLVIETSRENDNEVIFGLSPTIVVTNFSLAIEQHFLQNPHVTQVRDNAFTWYSKCGGKCAGLSVSIRLQDEEGRTVNTSTDSMKLKTELVYDDGSPTPEMPLAPLKAHRSSVTSRKPLYRPLVSDPILQPGQGSHTFTFRIEEVSFHHPGHAGFKLKVSPADPAQHLVHPGLLEETIVVLSKPQYESTNKIKQGGRRNTALPNLDGEELASKPRKPKRSATKKRKRGGRSSAGLSNLNGGEELAPKPKKVRKVSNVSTSATDIADVVAIPVRCLLDVSRETNGKCRFCNKKIEANIFLSVESHKGSCIFAQGLAAHVTTPAVSAPESNTRDQVKLIPSHPEVPASKAVNAANERFEANAAGLQDMDETAMVIPVQAPSGGNICPSTSSDEPMVIPVQAPSVCLSTSSEEPTEEPMVALVQAPNSGGNLSGFMPAPYADSDVSDVSLDDCPLPFDFDEGEEEFLSACSTFSFEEEEEACTYVSM